MKNICLEEKLSLSKKSLFFLFSLISMYGTGPAVVHVDVRGQRTHRSAWGPPPPPIFLFSSFSCLLFFLVLSLFLFVLKVFDDLSKQHYTCVEVPVQHTIYADCSCEAVCTARAAGVDCKTGKFAARFPLTCCSPTPLLFETTQNSCWDQQICLGPQRRWL